MEFIPSVIEMLLFPLVAQAFSPIILVGTTNDKLELLARNYTPKYIRKFKTYII
jgi:hypothetical protein